MRGLELYFSQRPSFFSLPHLLPAVRDKEPGPRAAHSAQQEGKGQLPLESRLLHLSGGWAGVRVAIVTARLLMPKRAGGRSEYTS